MPSFQISGKRFRWSAFLSPLSLSENLLPTGESVEQSISGVFTSAYSHSSGHVRHGSILNSNRIKRNQIKSNWIKTLWREMFGQRNSICLITSRPSTEKVRNCGNLSSLTVMQDSQCQAPDHKSSKSKSFSSGLRVRWLISCSWDDSGVVN